MKPLIKPGDRLLFQGDSITDCGRRDSVDGLGNGYVPVIKGWLEARPASAGHRLLNRGIGGDRTTELLARWQLDCLDLQPDLLSIMIGVNDVWRIRGPWEGQTWVPPELFLSNYRSLIESALASGIKQLALMSPTTIENETDAELSGLLDQRAATVQALAGEYRACYVPTREVYVAALKNAPDTQWTLDGCHPTVSGYALIAATWLEAIGLV